MVLHSRNTDRKPTWVMNEPHHQLRMVCLEPRQEVWRPLPEMLANMKE